jgi:peptide/nickel transport system ATP-binding protein
VNVLELRDLTIMAGDIPLVTGVSLELAAGERLGIIGESGSGKTLTALAMISLLPAALRASGQILLRGEDLNQKSERSRCQVRGTSIAMVFQEPMTALDPTMRVGKQIAEATGLPRAAARARALDLMKRVEFTDPAGQAHRYPHQLSGGQRQRVMLAMAIARDPAVIVADEPTTALDVTVQKQMLDLMSRLVDEEGSALVLISHDLAVVSEMCSRLVVMYGGRVAETGPTAQVLASPRHRYTAGLVATSAAITLFSDRARTQVPSIPGQVPAAGAFPAGCPFRNRCGFAVDECQVVPPLAGLDGLPDAQPGRGQPGRGRLVACWNPA